MRVIVWGINYAPEVTGIAPYNVALCEFLRERHHDVEMVTTFPYYPSWRKNRRDRWSIYRTDWIKGVAVHRCWHFVPARVTAAKRILHEATFVLASTLRALFLPRADVYVIVSPPLLLGAAAWLVTRLKRAPFVFHVQDLQPDAALGLGMLRKGWFSRLLYRLESFSYDKATRVSGISSEMLGIFKGKGVPENKLVFFPNGVALPDKENIPARGRFRQKHGMLNDNFLAVYAGNLGVKQGLSILVQAAPSLADSKIQIIICGDGSDRESLVRQIEAAGLGNVTLLPLLASGDYEEMLVDADVCLITQQSGSGNAFFPSKLLTTLAYSKPVVTVADDSSALARATVGGGFGVNVPPDRPQGLAGALRSLVGASAQLEQFATAGRAFVQQFEKNRVLDDFTRELELLVRKAPA